jgi:hypothetical protein
MYFKEKYMKKKGREKRERKRENPEVQRIK